MRFDDFIKIGHARRATKNAGLARSIIMLAEEDLAFLDSLEINEQSARRIMANYYDILRTFLEAIAAVDGFKVYSHEAFTFFLKEKGEDIFSIKFDRFRKIRNGINYYGKPISVWETKENIKEIKKMIPALKEKYLSKLNKTVYLTIDDSPSKNNIEKIDFLFNKKIPAAFFCIGKLLEKNPEPIIYAIKKGFVIGNHSYSHIHFSEFSLEDAYREIDRCDKIIEEIYKKANETRNFKLFRFPYGDKGGKNKEKLQEYLKKLGYSQKPFSGINYDYFREHQLDSDLDVFWTFDIEEYKLDLPEILKHIEETNPSQGGSLLNFSSKDIVLMHDAENNEKFFKIIEELERKAVFEGIK